MACPMPVALRRVLVGAASALATCGLLLLVFSGSTALTRPAVSPSLPGAGFAFATEGEETEPRAAVAVPLALSYYEHPSGAFIVRYPQDWQLDESERQALFLGPDDLAEILIRFEAPAEVVDLTVYLEHWVTGRYGAMADFKLGQQISQLDGSMLLLSSFTGGDGVRRVADTFGEAHEGVVFVESFVAATGLHDAYLPAFNEVINSLQYNSGAALAAEAAAPQSP